MRTRQVARLERVAYTGIEAGGFAARRDRLEAVAQAKGFASALVVDLRCIDVERSALRQVVNHADHEVICARTVFHPCVGVANAQIGGAERNRHADVNRRVIHGAFFVAPVCSKRPANIAEPNSPRVVLTRSTVPRAARRVPGASVQCCDLPIEIFPVA